ncbi:hypothetical protein C8Q74DRAFT_12589 [Fomes fomentarius]|nr:hypothetical protein C8Q74DRAFT_12589 [Fomes fomentarius]
MAFKFTDYRVDGDLADEDIASLAELPDPSHRRAWAISRIEEYTKRIYALKSVYNAAAPVHRQLPPEVLMVIFGEVKTWHLAARLTLLGVCRLWRHVVLRTPAFWARYISNRPVHGGWGSWKSDNIEHIQRLQVFLDLSCAHPIRLFISELPPSSMQMLVPLKNRITAFGAEPLAEQMPQLHELLRDGMPLLGSFELKWLRRDTLSHSPPISLDRMRFPRLHTLVAPLKMLDANSFDDRIRRICIHWYHQFPVSSTWEIADLLGILECCPRLEMLEVSVSLVTSTTVPPSRVVPLHSLRHLHAYRDAVEGDAVEGVASLFSHLDIPLAQCLVKTDRATIIRPRVFLSLPLAQLRNPREIHVLIEDRNVTTLELRTAVVSGFTLHARLMSRDEYLGDISDFLRVSPSWSITVLVIVEVTLDSWRQSRDILKRETINSLLSQLPQLLRLQFGECDGRRDLLPLLGGLEAGGAGHLCPKLQHLCTYWIYEDGGLLSSEENHEATNPAFCDMLADVLQGRTDLGELSLQSLDLRVPTKSLRKPLYQNDIWEHSAIRNRVQARLGHLLSTIQVRFEREGEPGVYT